jgi:hypothetical protein
VITERDTERARTVAERLGSLATGIGFDLAEPGGVADALRDIDHVGHIVIGCA